jgi:bacterioferritin-associated ferredoxin
MERKICTKCNEFKLLSEYHKNIRKPLGVNSQCVECRKPGKQLHYQNNKEKYKQAYQKFMERKYI